MATGRFPGMSWPPPLGAAGEQRRFPPRLGTRPDFAFMGLDDLINDGQTQSGAAFKLGLEGLEDFFHQLPAHARTGIGKVDLPIVAGLLQGNARTPPECMARTAFSQKFQNTCLILPPSAMAKAALDW